jgi:hypothetical protein
MTASINSSQSARPGSAARDRPTRSRPRTGRVPGETRHMNPIRKRLATLAGVSILAMGIPIAGASAAAPTTIKGPTINGGTVAKDPTGGLQWASGSAPLAISVLSNSSGGTVASGT